NGIKFFGPGGLKLSDQDEESVETGLPAQDDGWPEVVPLPTDDVIAEYCATAQTLLPARALDGWRLVRDCANGATTATTPAVLRALGAIVVGIGDTPDGHNINAGVGSEHPERLQTQVTASSASVGIAHDGDGDRCVLCDENGRVLSGDEVLTL